MKTFLFILLLFTGIASCKKSKDCTEAVVTLKAKSRTHVGIIINKTTYATNDLPDSDVIEGKKICIEYSLYDDLRMCQMLWRKICAYY